MKGTNLASEAALADSYLPEAIKVRVDNTGATPVLVTYCYPYTYEVVCGSEALTHLTNHYSTVRIAPGQTGTMKIQVEKVVHPCDSRRTESSLGGVVVYTLGAGSYSIYVNLDWSIAFSYKNTQPPTELERRPALTTNRGRDRGSASPERKIPLPGLGGPRSASPRPPAQ